MTGRWLSRVQGPITPQPDPSYANAYFDYQFQKHRPVPRVRNEGLDIAEGHRGCVGILFELQGEQENKFTRAELSDVILKARSRSQYENKNSKKKHKKGKHKHRKSRSTSKHRKKRSRSSSSSTSSSSSSSSDSSDALSDSRKCPYQSYEQLTPKSKSGMNVVKLQPKPTQQYRPYLRAHSKTGPPFELGDRPLTAVRYTPKPRVPTSNIVTDVKLVRRDVNYVRANAHAVSVSAANLRKSEISQEREARKKRQEDLLKLHKYGETPDYLVHRQKEWRRSQSAHSPRYSQSNSVENARKLEQKERMELIKLLKESHYNLTEELHKLPITTISAQLVENMEKNYRRRKFIETKMGQIESTLELLNCPNIYITDE